MRAQLVGQKKVSFVGKDGKTVEYSELHLMSSDISVDGAKCTVINSKDAYGMNLRVGGHFDFDYAPDNKGRAHLVGITEVPTAPSK